MSENITIGFNQLFTQMLRIFQIAYAMGYNLWSFLSTPLEETMPGISEMLGADVGMLAPFEFMIGLGLITVLITALVKFFMPI